MPLIPYVYNYAKKKPLLIFPLSIKFHQELSYPIICLLEFIFTIFYSLISYTLFLVLSQGFTLIWFPFYCYFISILYVYPVLFTYLGSILGFAPYPSHLSVYCSQVSSFLIYCLSSCILGLPLSFGLPSYICPSHLFSFSITLISLL